MTKESRVPHPSTNDVCRAQQLCSSSKQLRKRQVRPTEKDDLEFWAALLVSPAVADVRFDNITVIIERGGGPSAIDDLFKEMAWSED